MNIGDVEINNYCKLIERIPGEETFSDMVIRLVREKNLTPPEVYRNAGIDAKLYSKVISNRTYQPCKNTALAFAVGLKLQIDDANILLEKAGFAFNPSNRVDVIIKTFISEGIYDRKIIDCVMTNLNLPLLSQKR